jgi:hypothetical protein
MSVIDHQLDKLRQTFPNVEFVQQQDGVGMIKVSDVPLPAGEWNRTLTNIYFLVPIGYPMARPDSFWTEPDLRLANGSLPKGSSPQTPPFGGEPKMWFSWHPSSWSPNRDDLLTYTRLILDRLKRPE